ncbi:MAG: hypothetical protein KBB94_03180 [Legionellaceae bacterium]|nr:hypothetical protein [Legionellaceae bacterium]MBP9775213.1 hypothetical protein [Legionellaceae bacterium]
MKSKYLIVAVLAMGLSSVAAARSCSNDTDCQKINCQQRAGGVTIYLKNHKTPGQVSSASSAICKKVGGQEKGRVDYCSCNLTVEFPDLNCNTNPLAPSVE